MFSDIAATWDGVLEDMSDVKELVCSFISSIILLKLPLFLHLFILKFVSRKLISLHFMLYILTPEI